MKNYDEISFEDELDIFKSLDDESMFESIESDVDVEKIIYAIRKCSREIDFLRKLKKSRTNPIDEKINKLIDSQDKLKDFAVSLMGVHFPDRNTVDFPGVGKLTKRKVKGKWEVVDEGALVGFLRKHGKYDGTVTTKEVVSKKALPKAMSEIMKTESEDSIVGAKFVEPTRDVSLVVKFYED